MPDFLFEIYTEELPALYLQGALRFLKGRFPELLKELSLSFEETLVEGTTRRIVLFARGLPESTPSQEIEIQGPAEAAAFKDGKPTKALEGFARKHSVSTDTVLVRDTPKGRYCFLKKVTVGLPVAQVLKDTLPRLLKEIPFPKSMRWDATSVSFARPLRGILALLGQEVIPIEIGSLKATRRTRGHSFLSPQEIEIANSGFAEYSHILSEKFVVVESEKRRQTILEKVKSIFDKYGCEFTDFDLLDEVASMVEYPGVIEGTFSKSFLDLPGVVLEAAMREHQRYFALRARTGELLPTFVAVIDRTSEYAGIIREGHERVLNARLADARFFFEEDLKTPFSKNVEELKNVTLHQGLGTYYAKVQRLRNLVAFIGQKLKMSVKEILTMQKAAELCKADLVTLMVAEFPALQGRIGAEYARRSGESEEVAETIRGHYLPRRSDDPLPKTTFGAVLSLAEKFDNIVLFFGIGLIPTGSQDPYELRRQANAIVRIVWEHKFDLSLSDCLQAAAEAIQERILHVEIVRLTLSFLRERVESILLDRGERYDIVAAVLETGMDNLLSLRDRLSTLKRLSTKKYWGKLCEVVERTFNISRGTVASRKLDRKLLKEKEEKALYNIYKKTRQKFSELALSGEYIEASKLYCEAFSEPVHEFFDKVFVNVEDKALRDNRMVLNWKINRLYVDAIADLSKIVFEGKQEKRETR
jgi:glycyl-tRNA synthetase beta chain